MFSHLALHIFDFFLLLRSFNAWIQTYGGPRRSWLLSLGRMVSLISFSEKRSLIFRSLLLFLLLNLTLHLFLKLFSHSSLIPQSFLFFFVGRYLNFLFAWGTFLYGFFWTLLEDLLVKSFLWILFHWSQGLFFFYFFDFRIQFFIFTVVVNLIS